MKRKRRFGHSQEWHEQQMAEGPAGHLRAQGVRTWDDLKRLCQTLNERFDAWPEHAKRNYAFPNPEDRTHRLGKPSDH